MVRNMCIECDKTELLFFSTKLYRCNFINRLRIGVFSPILDFHIEHNGILLTNRL